MSRMAVLAKKDFKCKFLRLSKRMPYGLFSNIGTAFSEHDVVVTPQGVRVNGRLEWSAKKDDPDKVKLSSASESFNGVIYMENDKSYFISPWYLVNNHGQFGYSIEDVTGRVSIGLNGQRGLRPMASYLLGSYCILGHTNMHILLYSYHTESLQLVPYVRDGGVGHVNLDSGSSLTFPLMVL